MMQIYGCIRVTACRTNTFRRENLLRHTSEIARVKISLVEIVLLLFYHTYML